MADGSGTRVLFFVPRDTAGEPPLLLPLMLPPLFGAPLPDAPPEECSCSFAEGGDTGVDSKDAELEDAAARKWGNEFEVLDADVDPDTVPLAEAGVAAGGSAEARVTCGCCCGCCWAAVVVVPAPFPEDGCLGSDGGRGVNVDVRERWPGDPPAAADSDEATGGEDTCNIARLARRERKCVCVCRKRKEGRDSPRDAWTGDEGNSDATGGRAKKGAGRSGEGRLLSTHIHAK